MKVKSKRKMAGILAAVLIALVLLTFDMLTSWLALISKAAREALPTIQLPTCSTTA